MNKDWYTAILYPVSVLKIQFYAKVWYVAFLWHWLALCILFYTKTVVCPVSSLKECTDKISRRSMKNNHFIDVSNICPTITLNIQFYTKADTWSFCGIYFQQSVLCKDWHVTMLCPISLLNIQVYATPDTWPLCGIDQLGPAVFSVQRLTYSHIVPCISLKHSVLCKPDMWPFCGIH